MSTPTIGLDRAPDQVRARRHGAAGWAVLLLLLGLGAWFLVGRNDADAPGGRVGDEVAVPNGILRVDGVGAEEATHLPMAMPGMTHEPIAEGHFLLRVDATIGAVDGVIDYEPGDFRVSAPGFDPVEPYRAVAGPGRAFGGMSAPLLLVYEVPVDAGPFRFEYAGAQIELDPVDRQ